MSAYKVTRLSTESARPDEAQEAWRTWVSTLHGHFAFAFETVGYSGQIVQQASATYELVEWTGEAETMTRSRADVRRDPRESYRLIVPLSGTVRIAQTGRGGWVTPGEMALVPLDVPMRVQHEAGVRSLAMLVPGDHLESRFGAGVLPGRSIVSDLGLPRIVRDLVISLAEQRDALTGAEFDFACDRAVDLFCLALAGQTSSPDRASDAAVRDAVRRYVREHAPETDLSVAAMASDIGWSVRQVQVVLARAGTTASELIRQERLELARIRLAHPNFRAHSVARIASSVGYLSAGAFSTAYRRHFGCSPSDTRDASRGAST